MKDKFSIYKYEFFCDNEGNLTCKGGEFTNLEKIKNLFKPEFQIIRMGCFVNVILAKEIVTITETMNKINEIISLDEIKKP